MSSLNQLSVFIITKDEEANLERCLQSLPAGIDLLVVDSGSQDRTQEIARLYGARIFERPFDDFASQKNFAVDQCQHDWVLSLDADEVLVGNLEAVFDDALYNGAYGFRLRRHLVFMGREMRYGKTKDAPLRLFHRGHGRYEGSIHESVKLNQGRASYLTGITLLHHSYKDLADYFARFNRYTSAIADRHKSLGKKAPMVSHIFRPWLEFLSRYVFRLGFLDGYPGYTYALISSLYAYIKYAKLRELER
ncbi:glycosyltransferase family 2 protein [Pseudobacteriovorax antillogorgiicola]|uniref:Glycosyltransferase involved in cell wall bisynthesis n=1 Tax=Pseudobacteriovorax antillogorgiicola TaxID=1513793 RepID=A0A1Y6B4H7_9BACT|nr:glycosyltransferase family 2 protein [Pseudobacteriovorax antillogorgiicola]TCS59121.1 glycosyltransferase involved in cell wall biosynthesis [Pseudobacteriovorax antillogorgiicola]SME91550.1 Glycosyltransferase involved in cell wall bisynthesis [Pseudobacteriovorax antillogorgiicola]